MRPLASLHDPSVKNALMLVWLFVLMLVPVLISELLYSALE
jgi:hypothetical protein